MDNERGITMLLCYTHGYEIIDNSFNCRKFLQRKRKFSWDGVWTLVILQYSHVVYTSLSILNCPTISVYQGDDSAVRVVYV